MKKAFIIALLVAININSAVCCAEELIELVGVYEFSDGHSAVLLKNNSKETVCIEINIDIRDENGELVRNFDNIFFGVTQEMEVMFDFYKDETSDVIDLNYDIYDFGFELTKEDYDMFYSNNTEFIQYEEIKDEDYEKTICFKNNSEEEVVIYPYIVWYKDNEVVGVECGVSGNIAAGDEAIERYSYPLYDDWIIPDDYKIIVGTTSY